MTLTVGAASQADPNLSGTLSADGSSMTGTYNTVATPDCGNCSSCGLWMRSHSAADQVNGWIGGTFWKILLRSVAVTGVLNQGPNTGANDATVTGTLNFQGYPCLDTASVNGQISGSSVILQLIAANGLNVGQIGFGPPIANHSTKSRTCSTGFDNESGYILQGQSGYGVSTPACPSGASASSDSGYICLGLGSSTACTQPLLITPALLTFPAQPVGSPATSQTIKLTNPGASGATLNNLTINLPFIKERFQWRTEFH